MGESEAWIATINGEGEINVRPYDGFRDIGDEGVEDLTSGEVYFAVDNSREAAAKRVTQYWERAKG